jgi:hypothetical protein
MNIDHLASKEPEPRNTGVLLGDHLQGEAHSHGAETQARIIKHLSNGTASACESRLRASGTGQCLRGAGQEAAREGGPAAAAQEQPSSITASL